MQLSANDRRIIIEDILDIGIFSVMKNLLKDRMSSLKEEITELEYNIKLLQEKISLHENHIEELKAKSSKKREDNNDKIESIGWRPEFSLELGIQELIKGYNIIRPNIYANI